MNELVQTRWLPVLLLIFSNVFMTFAWYGHLRHKSAPLWLVILASWGNSVYSATELKIIQEVITIVVFCVFAVSYLHEKLHWHHFAAFVCILGAVVFTFLPKD